MIITSEPFRIESIDPPSFKYRPENVEAELNENITLSCLVDANPSPDIIWVFDPIDRVNCSIHLLIIFLWFLNFHSNRNKNNFAHFFRRRPDKFPATCRWRIYHPPFNCIERNGRPLLLQSPQYRFPGDKCRSISHTERIAKNFIAQRAVSGRCWRVWDRVSCDIGAEGKTCVVGIQWCFNRSR